MTPLPASPKSDRNLTARFKRLNHPRFPHAKRFADGLFQSRLRPGRRFDQSISQHHREKKDQKENQIRKDLFTRLYLSLIQHNL